MRQRTTDNKPIFILVKNKYNLAGYEVCYINLYRKQGIEFGYWPAEYLVHSFPDAKMDIYKAFSPFTVEGAQGTVCI